MSKTLTDITAQLEEPFAIADIDLLPKGQVERDGKTLCMALPYADPRVYQDRLNKVVPGEWSTPPPIALAVGQKIVVYVTVTIYGISHTDVGEASATSENAATESYAQAFKRACSQFGLGRYLYDLEKAWVPYNKQRKQIDLDATGIQRTVQQMYVKARIAPRQPEKPAAPTAPVKLAEHKPESNGSTQQAAANEAKATEQQVSGIRKLCQATKTNEPENFADMSQDEAKDLIAQLTTRYKKQRLEQARQRVEALGMHWDDAKADAGFRLKDEDLTGKQIQAIENVIAQYEQRATGKAS